MRLTGQDLYRALFAPRSIALIGASDDPAKTTGRPLSFLQSWGYGGRVYPVNSTRPSVQGQTAWPSVAALPEVPEHAYLLVPTEAVLSAAQECAQAGVKVLTVLASGFSESGLQGRQREEQLRQLAMDTGMRVLGPSSLGMVNTGNQLVLSANAAFAEPGLPAGSLFLASQSGSMLGALASRARERGIGFAGMVSVGGETDVSLGEICEASVHDPRISAYLLFLETIRDAGRMRAFAIAAAAAGKPVLVYKLGRTAAAAELAQSHTGAMAGEDAVADTFLRECGIARLETLEGFLEAAPLLCQQCAGTKALRVGIVTTTGGGAAMLVDQLGLRGIEVQTASASSYARLAAAGVQASPGRIVDLTMAGTRPEVMHTTLHILTSSNEFDLVVVVVGSSARHTPERAVEPVIALHRLGRKVAAFVVPDALVALRLLSEAGVPAFRNPESCADAIAAACRRRLPRVLPLVCHVEAAGSEQLDEWESGSLLEELGMRFAPAQVLDARQPAAPALDYPLVAKVLSREIAHKSDVGGVVLGIRDQAQLESAIATIRQNLMQKCPALRFYRVLVQSMVKGVGEMMLGYRVDPVVGPIVLLAAGGLAAELLDQKVMRLAPVDHVTAREMVGELPACDLLNGYRGRPRGDIEALVQAIVQFSQLALSPGHRVVEAEVNPLLVREEGQGVLGLDALVSVARSEGRRGS